MSSLPIDASYSNPFSLANLKRKESMMAIGGGALFVITTVVLTILLIAQPHIGVVGFSILGVLEVGTLVACVVGLTLYNKQYQQTVEVQRKAMEDKKRANEALVDEINSGNIQKVEIDEFDPSKISGDAPTYDLSYIDEIRNDLPPLFNSLEKFLKAFVEGYYKVNNKPAEHLNEVHQAVELISTQIQDFLQSPQERLRTAFCISAYNILDPNKITSLLKGKEVDMLTGLPDSLLPPIEGFETQHALTKHILQVLCNQEKLVDATLIEKIQTVRDKHALLLAANGEAAVNEATAYYKVALFEMLDYFYSRASLSQEQIDAWTVHLIPPYLENLRGDFFEFLSTNLVQVNNAFTNKAFDSKWLKIKLTIGRSDPETHVHPLIDLAVAPLPLNAERQKVLSVAAQKLFASMIDPFLYGICGGVFSNNPYREKVERIIGSPDFTSPKPDGNDWKAYIDAYAKFFKMLANKLTQ